MCHDEKGKPIVYIEDAPWGTSALFVCNADPAVRRIGPDNVNQADCYYSARIAAERYGSGLVLEQGGVLSHGAIVAREVGLPAIVNVPDATSVIHTGQEIVIDGTCGRVTTVASGATVQPLIKPWR